VSSAQLRAEAQETGISSIQIFDEMGQWVEIRKAGEQHEAIVE
jgi:hypothetical protein